MWQSVKSQNTKHSRWYEPFSRPLLNCYASRALQPDRDNDKYINSQTHPEQNVDNVSFRVRLFGFGNDFKKGRRVKPVSKRNVWNSNCFFGHRLTLCSTFSRPNPIAILKSCLIRTYKHAHTHTERRRDQIRPLAMREKFWKPSDSVWQPTLRLYCDRGVKDSKLTARTRHVNGSSK